MTGHCAVARSRSRTQRGHYCHKYTTQMVASTWLDYHHGRPSALTNSLHKLHMVRYQVIILQLLTKQLQLQLQCKHFGCRLIFKDSTCNHFVISNFVLPHGCMASYQSIRVHSKWCNPCCGSSWRSSNFIHSCIVNKSISVRSVALYGILFGRNSSCIRHNAFVHSIIQLHCAGYYQNNI